MTFAGVVLGVVGTLLICRPYHPFSLSDLLKHVFFTLIPMVIRGAVEEAHALIRTTSRLSEINEEDRAKSLLGVYLVLAGFFFQTVGAVLWTADAAIVP